MFGLIVALAFLFFQMTIHAYASCIEEWVLCEKLYIKPDQLYLESNTIYVQLANNRLIETTAVHFDKHGLYIKDYKQKKCDQGQWYCGVCGHCNPNYKIWCEICWN